MLLAAAAAAQRPCPGSPPSPFPKRQAPGLLAICPTCGEQLDVEGRRKHECPARDEGGRVLLRPSAEEVKEALKQAEDSVLADMARRRRRSPPLY